MTLWGHASGQLPTQNDKLDFAQPANSLSEFAEAERAKLFPRNDYSPKSDLYSAQHPDAMADGDKLGRGTSKFLDIYNHEVGTSTDIQARVENTKIDQYSPNKPYPSFEL